MSKVETVILIIALCTAIAFVVFARPTARRPLICVTCGTEGETQTKTPGSIFIEIILWICFIVPGLIYSVWRLSSRGKVCRVCGSDLISVSSPRGQQLARNLGTGERGNR
jgi:hypothetical protein